jgi:hypothetical protein
MYEVKLSGVKSVNFMIMKNSIQKLSPKNQIYLKFDLKGSKINRRSLPKGASSMNNEKF